MIIEERSARDASTFRSLTSEGRPFVLRGLARDWPMVRAAAAGLGAVASYLKSGASPATASCVVGTPEIDGRFFYRADMRGFNFGRRDATLPALVEELQRQADQATPLAIAMQSAPADRMLPRFVGENPMPLLPESVRPRLWIGNRVRVATHYDANDNLACVVAGRRRFILFPPEQIGNLYPGPLETTPAGTPVSMVDPERPDLERYPRFAEAREHMLTAELGPGDAIFIPYFWWHAVTSLDPLSMLVNYWWNDEGDDTAQVEAMLHALLALQDLPPRRRAIWNGMFAHFVLQQNGDPAAHIAPSARGVLGGSDAAAKTDLLDHLTRSLARRRDKIAAASNAMKIV